MCASDLDSLKKGGFIQQKQKDRFSLRLAVVGGALSADSLYKIASLAEHFGSGRVHLTARQSVEIPFVRLDEIEKVKEELAQLGLKAASCGARVRTVTACQGNAICASGNIDTYALAVVLNDRYLGRELPHKFKFGITGCLNNCLKAEENDLGIKGAWDVRWRSERCIGCGLCMKACRSSAITLEERLVKVNPDSCTHCGRCVKACPVGDWDVKVVYIVSFGGLFGNQICRGSVLLPLVKSKEQLLRITDAAIAFFQKYGENGERFRFTIDRIGKDIFRKSMEEAYGS